LDSEEISKAARGRVQRAIDGGKGKLHLFGRCGLYLFTSLIWLIITIILIHSDDFITNFMANRDQINANLFDKFSASTTSKGLLGLALVFDIIILILLGHFSIRPARTGNIYDARPILLTALWGTLCIISLLFCVLLVFVDGLGIKSVTSANIWTLFSLIILILFVRFCSYFPQAQRADQV
jgi:hypothetical protein